MGVKQELSAAEMESRLRDAAAREARVSVSWKDEGGPRVGQIKAIDLDKYDAWEAAEIARLGVKPIGYPYFGPVPEFILAEFWGSRGRARKLAKALNAEFAEY